MGSDIFDSIGIGTDLVVIILAVIILIQFIIIFTIISKYNKLNDRVSRFTSGRDGESLEEVLAKRFSEMRQIVKNEKQI